MDPISNSDYSFDAIRSLIAHSYGHERSFLEKSAIDSKGLETPWFSYPAIEFLNVLDLSNFKVLEWGAGNSSVYFSRYSREVYSIEDNDEWYQKIKNLNLRNHFVYHAQGDEYVSLALELDNEFDLVLIDGKKRKDCAKIAPKILSQTGFIILDNADWYPETCKELENQGFNQVDFSGLGPINSYAWTTSIFYRSQFKNFPRRTSIRPMGGLNNNSD